MTAHHLVIGNDFIAYVGLLDLIPLFALFALLGRNRVKSNIPTFIIAHDLVIGNDFNAHVGLLDLTPLSRLVTIPYYPLSDVMRGEQIVRLQLNRIKKWVEARYKIPFEYSEDVVRLVVSRCTESESGGENN